jgi:hypothetical protein
MKGHGLLEVITDVLASMEKNHENVHDKRASGRQANPRSHEYKADVPTTHR